MGAHRRALCAIEGVDPYVLFCGEAVNVHAASVSGVRCLMTSPRLHQADVQSLLVTAENAFGALLILFIQAFFAGGFLWFFLGLLL